MTDVVADCIARMNADSDRLAVIRRRIITDPRRNALNEYAVSLKAELADGMLGGMLMFSDLFSVEAMRRKRAECLFVAREQSIRGFHDAAKFWLSKAAMARREEKFRAGRADASAYREAAE